MREKMPVTVDLLQFTKKVCMEKFHFLYNECETHIIFFLTFCSSYI